MTSNPIDRLPSLANDKPPLDDPTARLFEDLDLSNSPLNLVTEVFWIEQRKLLEMIPNEATLPYDRMRIATLFEAADKVVAAFSEFVHLTIAEYTDDNPKQNLISISDDVARLLMNDADQRRAILEKKDETDSLCAYREERTFERSEIFDVQDHIETENVRSRNSLELENRLTDEYRVDLYDDLIRTLLLHPHPSQMTKH